MFIIDILWEGALHIGLFIVASGLCYCMGVVSFLDMESWWVVGGWSFKVCVWFLWSCGGVVLRIFWELFFFDDVGLNSN